MRGLGHGAVTTAAHGVQQGGSKQRGAVLAKGMHVPQQSGRKPGPPIQSQLRPLSVVRNSCQAAIARPCARNRHSRPPCRPPSTRVLWAGMPLGSAPWVGRTWAPHSGQPAASSSATLAQGMANRWVAACRWLSGSHACTQAKGGTQANREQGASLKRDLGKAASPAAHRTCCLAQTASQHHQQLTVVKSVTSNAGRKALTAMLVKMGTLLMQSPGTPPASLSACCITFDEGVAQGWLPTTVTILALAAMARRGQDAARYWVSCQQPKNAMSESCLADMARGCMERLKELAGKITASHGPCTPAQDRDCHREQRWGPKGRRKFSTPKCIVSIFRPDDCLRRLLS